MTPDPRAIDRALAAYREDDKGRVLVVWDEGPPAVSMEPIDEWAKHRDMADAVGHSRAFLVDPGTGNEISRNYVAPNLIPIHVGKLIRTGGEFSFKYAYSRLFVGDFLEDEDNESRYVGNIDWTDH